MFVGPLQARQKEGPHCQVVGRRFSSDLLGDLGLAAAGELNDALHGWLREGADGRLCRQ